MPPKFIQFNKTEIYQDMLTLEEFEAQRAAVEELPSVTLVIFMGKWAVYLIDGMEITKYEVLRTSTTVGEPCPIDSVHEDIVRHLYPEEPHPPDVIPIVVGKSGEEKAEAEQMAAQERKDLEEEKAKKDEEIPDFKEFPDIEEFASFPAFSGSAEKEEPQEPEVRCRESRSLNSRSRKSRSLHSRGPLLPM
mgnify:CR=1 FL=1